MILIIKHYINLDSLHCPNHDLLNIFLNSLIQLLIFSFIKEINCIWKIGEKKPLQHTNNIKIAALKYHNIYKTKTAKINSMKFGGKWFKIDLFVFLYIYI